MLQEVKKARDGGSHSGAVGAPARASSASSAIRNDRKPSCACAKNRGQKHRSRILLHACDRRRAAEAVLQLLAPGFVLLVEGEVP